MAYINLILCMRVSVAKPLRVILTGGQQTKSIGIPEEILAVHRWQLPVLRGEHAMCARAIDSISTHLHAIVAQEGALQDRRINGN